MDLRSHLGELQLPQIVHGRRGIILIEGPQGAAKKHALRQLAAAFDPCHVTVHNITYDRRQSSEGHWLARFWRALPNAGGTSIFFRSWYRRVLDDRILGRTDDASLTRAFDEINEFEAQQRDYGTLIVKLYFDVSPDVQEERLRARASNPWLGVIRNDDLIGVRDAGYRRALDELKSHTDTRWSPWRFINGDDEEEAAISALTAIADAWEKAMPAEPPRLVSAPTQAA
ncbi:MAG: polyphosphate kinase 2 family protein [Sphingomicrobium sp.]